MAVVLTLLSSQPTKTQFGLDQLTLEYKSDSPWDVTVVDAGLPKPGDAHSTFAFMFVTDVRLQEAAETACTFDVTYQGAFASSGGNPILRPGQLTTSNPVESSTSTESIGVAGPVTGSLQFYAQQNELRWVTYLTKGTLNTCPNPTGDPIVISYQMGDTAYSPGSIGIDQYIAMLFQISLSDTLDSEEIVAGKYFANVERKLVYYSPLLVIIVDAGGGRFVSLYRAGTGYSVGNSLTCSAGAGQSASMTVTSVGPTGAISGFSVGSDTISASIFLVIGATGGSGTGAAFRFYGA